MAAHPKVVAELLTSLTKPRRARGYQRAEQLSAMDVLDSVAQVLRILGAAREGGGAKRYKAYESAATVIEQQSERARKQLSSWYDAAGIEPVIVRPEERKGKQGEPYPLRRGTK